MLSSLTKAHLLGTLFFAQISGFVWRQPHVCFSESSFLSGSWNALLFLMVLTLSLLKQGYYSAYKLFVFIG